MNDHDGKRRRRGGGISVVGSGEVTVEPDMATLSVGINWQDTDLNNTRAMVASRATAARDYLVSAGVDPIDIRTTNLSVHPIRRDNRPGSRNTEPTSYAVSTTMLAVFRNSLEQAQTAVDNLFEVVGEALQLNGLNFDCSDRAAAESEARTLAFDDAKAKAEQLADLAGASLGPIRGIREEHGGGGHQPRRARGAMMAAKASIPIEGGSLAETVTLQIRWSISDEA